MYSFVRPPFTQYRFDMRDSYFLPTGEAGNMSHSEVSSSRCKINIELKADIAFLLVMFSEVKS